MAPPSEIVLGIDLGTSFSTAAAFVDGRMYLALDSRGEACIPSVVHFPRSGPPVVGAEADRLRASDPENTVAGIKRLVGRSADSPAARLVDACSSFRIKGQGSAEAAVQVRGGQHSASEVASLILRHLRERAEARFQRPLRRAVLTVPATAPPEVHQAMVRCGRMAGLEVVRILPEPCAGALARGLMAASGPRPLLVYDFGGGTLDAAVVRRAGAQLQVLSASGDDCLGGDDLDTAFARWVASGIWRAFQVDVTRDVILRDRIQRRCELVKRSLSAAPEARFQLRDAFNVGGQPQQLDVAVRREHLAPQWAELVERSVMATGDALRDAQLATAELAGVLLIGGTTYVPQVREAVARAFPVPCLVEEEPQTAVARGAAMLAAQPQLLAA